MELIDTSKKWLYPVVRQKQEEQGPDGAPDIRVPVLVCLIGVLALCSIIELALHIF